MTNNTITFWEYTFMLSFLIGVLSMLSIVTVAFPKIAEVEKKIATEGKQIASVRVVFGGGPIGRWVRAMHVFAFFVFKRIPKFGSKIAARYGDETEPLPLRLKLWATVPHVVCLMSMAVWFAVGLSINFK